MKKIISCILLLTAFSSLSAEYTRKQLKQSVCDALPQINGWCSQEKALSFIDLVLEVKPNVCVDIGSFAGASLFPVAKTLKFLKNGVVIGIDPWDTSENLRHFDLIADPVNTLWWAQINFDSIFSSCKTMIQNYDLTDYCILYRMTSEKAAANIDQIDILYIDGGHSEGAFTTDVLLYLPKVRNGGYIWLNDSLWEQAQYAIEILMERCDVVDLIDNGNCILFKKREG